MPVEISHDLSCTDISTQEQDNYTDIGEPVPTNDQDANESSVMSVLPAVIEELQKDGKFQVLEIFFRLVKEKQFPVKNIAFQLWSDVVKCFDKTDTRQMRYSQESL